MLDYSRSVGHYLATAAVLLLVVTCFPLRAADFLISTQADFDMYRQATFSPGDNILFERGKSFTGMFSPTTIGAAGNPITISTFGNGDRPVINNGGVFHPHPTRAGETISAGVLLFNAEYTELRGLEVTNATSFGQDAAHFGIYVLGEDTGKYHNGIHIEDNYVHSVNEGVAGKRRGGIHVHGYSPTGTNTATYNDLRIVNNVVDRVGGVGIGTDVDDLVDAHDFVGTSRENAITNLYVAHNWVGNTGRNTYIARDSDYAVYEYNTSANSSRHDTGHSFFNFRTLGLTFQYNEAYGNVGAQPGESDRGGFDADYNNRDTTIQYNYSHGNEWFAGIMKRPNKDVVIRYNLSVNEQSGAYFYGFENDTSLEDLNVYNNTHYFDASITPEMIVNGRTPHDSTFNNNIFYAAGSGTPGPNADNGTDVSYDTNVYYNFTPPTSEVNPLFGDPILLSPGAEPFNVDMQFGRNVLAGYQLASNSPYIDAGVSIAKNGGLDFWGNPVPVGGTDIGASEVGGIVSPGPSILTGNLFPTAANAGVIAGTPSATGLNGDDALASLSQTFQVDSTFDLKTIYLDYEYDPSSNPSEILVNVEIFEVADVGASSITQGTSLLTLTGLNLPELSSSDEAAIVLETAVTLPETSGTAGYALRITNGGNPGFEWLRTGSTAGSVYAQGQAYEDGAEKFAGERDFVLALSSLDPTSVTMPGDFNGDGMVTVADYSVWRASMGAAADYDQWRANFGQSAGSGVGVGNVVVQVPEPIALTMLALAVGTWSVNRRWFMSSAGLDG